MSKTVCFIDSNYLNASLTMLFNRRPRVNYEKLIAHLTGNDPNLLRTYFYDCRTFMSQNPTEEEQNRRAKQQKFHDYLQTLPQFECRFGRLKKVIDENGETHFEQKKVDVMFSIDLVKLATKHLIDKAYLMTGDLDMLPAIQVAKEEGVIIHLWYAKGCTHQDLLRGVDIAHEMYADGFKNLIDFYLQPYGGYSQASGRENQSRPNPVNHGSAYQYGYQTAKSAIYGPLLQNGGNHPAPARTTYPQEAVHTMPQPAHMASVPNS